MRFAVQSKFSRPLASCHPKVISSVTLSPVSVAACGLVSSEKGLSLRFPRFVRKRGDKDIQSASTPEFLANMWRSQQGVSKEDDDDLMDIMISESELEEEEFDE